MAVRTWVQLESAPMVAGAFKPIVLATFDEQSGRVLGRISMTADGLWAGVAEHPAYSYTGTWRTADQAKKAVELEIANQVLEQKSLTAYPFGSRRK